MKNITNGKQEIKPLAAPGVNDFVIQNLMADVKEKKLKKVKILDLGTGEGYNLYKLKEKLEELKINYEFIAVDINEENFKLKETENIKFIKADLNNDFDFERENFDFVIATEVIDEKMEHIMPIFPFIINYKLKKIERKKNYSFDLKIYYSRNVIKIPKFFRINNNLTFCFTFPGRIRLLGDIVIYKIIRLK